jgi:hypothetical protein
LIFGSEQGRRAWLGHARGIAHQLRPAGPQRQAQQLEPGPELELQARRCVKMGRLEATAIEA